MDRPVGLCSQAGGVSVLARVGAGDVAAIDALHGLRTAEAEARLRRIRGHRMSARGRPGERPFASSGTDRHLASGDYPPARAGRMNAAGTSVFYGAREAQTCISEVRAPVGSHIVIGRFEIIRPVRLLDSDVLTRVVVDGSPFDPEYGTRLSRAAFLRHLVGEISRPVMPRDEEFEYLPTQAVAQYLAECASPRLDGVIFRSSQTNGRPERRPL